MFHIGSRPDSRVARLRNQRHPPFGLRLLGRPLGTLDIQRGRLRFVIRNVARSLLPPVIPVPSSLAPLSGRHHRPSCACARAVDTSRRATATATRPHAQAHDNTSRCTAATTTTTTAMTTTNVDDEASCASARYFHIASRKGNDDNNYGNKVDKVDNEASYITLPDGRRR